MASRILRFPELAAQGGPSNRQTLGRWQRLYGFPDSIQLAPNTVGWDQDEVVRWVKSRPRRRSKAGVKGLVQPLPGRPAVATAKLAQPDRAQAKGQRAAMARRGGKKPAARTAPAQSAADAR